MSHHTLAADGSDLAPETAAKAAAARDAIAERDGVLVAFSGGVDSSVVAALARDALGDDAVACTARSETLPAAELDDATRVADEIGIAHETVTFSELDDPNFVANDGDRCYHCRTMRLGRMYETATDLGIDTVCDGTNADDPGEGHRPGLRAVEELDVFSPLLDAGITKDEVRAIADAYDLSVADKPSMACLSSRIPTGLEVTEERLSRVEKAERVLREWGFEGFRVRDHDGLARVEIAPDELERALDPAFADAVHEHLTDVGFEYVTLDMAGYRTGSVSPGADADEEEAGEEEAGEEEAETGDGEDRDGTAESDGRPVDLGRQYPR
ncbi:ATP-dependent sacrificial sulfur transferase LarE [Halorubrum kocurii]|uniref:tRNA (5-methylaminomethyl-2-thiouridylate)-methyltransferase n=1 Tax=Halorubrum kocurii JCM 14978 TaxID=1230456 RepID=M0PCM1_9EURY|nr:ATP-dependent sacrificial sulfur transferase LarE [Halorubrum kocurii]EMA67897.1 tRNA (5-methylaminomethyl-2-thiouridylate)-methyltransferase [Halorubrum kocurii JCM 14978]